jgi:redox-sensitive bicupin YhaK (pirin superfamily)
MIKPKTLPTLTVVTGLIRNENDHLDFEFKFYGGSKLYDLDQGAGNLEPYMEDVMNTNKEVFDTFKKSRRIALRTSGRGHGPITRLMSPSDFGQILKPFVFLDLVNHEGGAFEGPLHPHSGIATLTYLAEGTVNYIDPDNNRGVLLAGGVEWMQAGSGMWHGGGIRPGRTRGFQLWIALPPEHELGPAVGIYLAPEEIRIDGPASILLGSYGNATSAIKSPSSINYLAVCMKAGEKWFYQPPSGHTVLWAAVATGALTVPERVNEGDLVAFEHSEQAVEFKALTDTEFVLGSAVPHDYALVTGYYSVHTSIEALVAGEAHISVILRFLDKEANKKQKAPSFDRAFSF